MSTGKKLAQTAQMLAERPFHGRTADQPSNLLPIVRLFPKWNLEQAERMWCAAFVYYCCIRAGFSIPYSPQECRSCSLAGCGGWEEFAQEDKRIAYYDGQQAIRDTDFVWQEGDILLYDRVFINKEHDHIGILLKLEEEKLVVAEGNVRNTNCSGVVRREKDEHIRAIIRIPDGFVYEQKPTERSGENGQN